MAKAPEASALQAGHSGKPQHPLSRDGRFLRQVVGRLNSGGRDQRQRGSPGSALLHHQAATEGQQTAAVGMLPAPAPVPLLPLRAGSVVVVGVSPPHCSGPPEPPRWQGHL